MDKIEPLTTYKKPPPVLNLRYDVN